jgi:AraC-like DNA-binding protein
MIQTLSYPVHPALQPFVRSIVMDEFRHHAPSGGVTGFYPPTPLHNIFIYLGETISARTAPGRDMQPHGRCVVVGPQTQPVQVTIPSWQRVIVFRFQPGGLFRLLGLPLHEIIDTGIPGIDLLGEEAKRLTDRLRNIPDNQEVCRHAEQFLLSKLHQLKPTLPLDEALSLLVKQHGNIPVDTIASLACLSTRQFERRCQERLGMSPKLFSRITRFSHAYRMYEANPILSWTDIAHTAGYFDQMHFIRDFKQFTGATPTAIEKLLSTTPIRLQADLVI